MVYSIFTVLFKNKTIFIAPLDWGLGHATRCVSIIKQLSIDNTVLLGVTPLTKIIFDEELPGLKQIELPSYNVRYSNIFPLWMKLGFSVPQISRIIAEENTLLAKLISTHKIDVVISDNRFGLHSKKAYSVFITHQLFLKAPVFVGIANRINKKYILNFNEVWVPDYEGENSLSGELSQSKNHPDSYRDHKNVKYIGAQSRLKDIVVTVEENKYDYLILLSGPEPIRTSLENILVNTFKNSDKKIALVRGTKSVGICSWQSAVSCEVFDLPSKEILKKLILSSHKIICRSGYSTLMDMHLLGKKELILIPTPGQSEQEYLAKYWKEKFGAEIILQKEIKKLNSLKA